MFMDSRILRIFLANNLYTRPVDGVAYVLSVFGHSRLEIAGLHYNILNILVKYPSVFYKYTFCFNK